MMEKIEFNVPFNELKTIWHISDVHIRNYKRHKEYRQVFKELYKELKKDCENSLILLAGDIVHSKIDMSPELIKMVHTFLSNCASIAPTLLIMGNHDCVHNNRNRLDALSPIVDTITNPNLLYVKRSSIVEVADCQFSVCSFLDKIEDWPKISDLSAKTKIAVYHGTVDNSSLDSGFVLKSDKVKIETFDGYDMVLLGDIHYGQTLQEYSTNELIVDESELKKYLNEGWEIIEEIL